MSLDQQVTFPHDCERDTLPETTQEAEQNEYFFFPKFWTWKLWVEV